MYTVAEYFKLAKLFPALTAGACLLMIVDALFSAASVVTIAPLADLLLERPEEDWLAVTRHAKSLAAYAGVDFSILVVVSVIWISLLGMSIVSVLVRFNVLKIRYAVVRHLLKKTYEHVYSARWSFFTVVSKGELINTFIHEVNKVGSAFFAIANLAANITRIIGFIMVPMLVQPLLVMFCVVGFGVIMYPFMIAGSISYKHGRRNVKTANKYVALVKESLDAVKDVLSFGEKNNTIGQVDRAFKENADNSVKSESVGFFFSQMYEPAGFLVLFGILWYAKLNEVALSAIAVTLWGVLRTIPSLKQSIHLKHQLNNFLPSYEQVLRYQHIAHDMRQENGGKRIEGVEKGIRLEGVSVRYDNDHLAVNNVSMELSRGEIVAFVGESGAGKTTLVNLLLGLQEPESGRILIDGNDAAECNLEEWRKHIGVVTQKPVLFDLSIKENLRWAKPSATDEEIWEACRLAQVDKFIEGLPQGLETEIGEDGVRLSGGQVQRIAIARAVIRKPQLLVLDEATSALDNENENEIYRNIVATMKYSLIVVIAHRLSTIANADRIYVMRNGEVLQKGSFGELSKIDGYFKRLLSYQISKTDVGSVYSQ